MVMSANSREYPTSVALFMSVARTKYDMVILGHFIIFDVSMRLYENLDRESEGKMADAIFVIRSTHILRKQVGRSVKHN